MATMVTRRKFICSVSLGIVGMQLFPGCERRISRSIDPIDVLNDLSNSKVINELREGKIIFVHKSFEGLSLRGKEALSIIQRGLISLELLPPLPEKEFGVYGDKTTKAINYLQNWAGVNRVQGWDGRKIEAETLRALERALQEKIAGRWEPPKNF